MTCSRHSYLWLLLLFLVLTAIDATSTYFLAARGLKPSPETSFFGTMMYSMTVTGWVYLDRRSRALNLPFEFDTFMFLRGLLCFRTICTELVVGAGFSWRQPSGHCSSRPPL
jgi:hypothetical protein